MGAGLAVSGATLLSAWASADSFTPVRVQVAIAPVARLHRPLALAVSVTADPQALNTGGGTVRAQVKLTSGECAGTFQTTDGVVLLDKPLRPQPGTGSYAGTASGSGRPTAYGVQTVCAFIDNDYQQLANNTTDPAQVNVSPACTSAAARYDRARRHGRHRGTQPSRRTVSADRRAARRACGPGVPL